MTDKNETTLDKIVSLAKRRGFVLPGSEIYGGLANSYDYGHLGAELFHNIAKAWWKRFVQRRDDIYGVRGPIIMNPKVWEASGHTKHFADPLIECKICHSRFRQDKEEEVKEHEKSHKEAVTWTEPKNFNQLFKTHIGPVEDEKATVYLRGETAQTMFTDFRSYLDTTRTKIPFGIAQIGKVFRNEITTGNFIFRMREFTIAEFEYFVKPGTDEEIFEELAKEQMKFLVEDLGLKETNLKPVDLSKEELAHYSKRTIDTYFNFPFGWDEITGIANRTDFDLKNHIEASGEDLRYKDPETGEEYIPFVVEPTFGLDRIFLAVLVNAYTEVEARSGKDVTTHETEVVLKLPKSLAPYKVAILPLSKKAELTQPAKELAQKLRKEFMVVYDETQSIGKRYRRQDEIGTPYCLTFDFDSLQDKMVTIRDRDSMAQDRVAIEAVSGYLREHLQ